MLEPIGEGDIHPRQFLGQFLRFVDEQWQTLRADMDLLLVELQHQQRYLVFGAIAVQAGVHIIVPLFLPSPSQLPAFCTNNRIRSGQGDWYRATEGMAGIIPEAHCLFNELKCTLRTG
jgi:hypothetical protein